VDTTYTSVTTYCIVTGYLLNVSQILYYTVTFILVAELMNITFSETFHEFFFLFNFWSPYLNIPCY